MSRSNVGEPDRLHATQAYGGQGVDAKPAKRDASAPPADFDEYWDMPEKYWRCVTFPPFESAESRSELEVTKAEMALIEVRGAIRCTATHLTAERRRGPYVFAVIAL